MNELQIFNNEDFGEIRMIKIGNKPYAVGIDVARALRYANPSKAIIDHCKGVSKLGIPSNGGIQDTNVIPESDIYRLIVKAAVQSKSEEVREKAEKFERWIFEEVLPSIRKTGVYATKEAAKEILRDPAFIAAALEEIERYRIENEQLTSDNNLKNQQIAELQPKATYYDVVLNCKDAISISVIAKDYGKTAQWLNEKLKELGVQFKQSKIWLLYRNHAENGYTCTKTHVHENENGESVSTVHTYWTQKGRLFIYDILKQNGHLPLIELSEAAS